jgi:5'-nucleotidase
VLAANLSADDVPQLSQVTPSVTVEVGGQKIGLIGLVTAETPEITMNFSGKEQLRWRDDYAAVVNAEAEKLSAAGVNKIILITHIGLGIDEQTAAQLKNVDVIVGGHSHTLLSDTYKAAGEHDYPETVDDANGNPVYIVQAGDRTRYLGRLNLEFDAQGNITRARGDTILLSRYITPDPSVQALLDELAEPINELKQTPVRDDKGQTVINQVMLSNKDCRNSECAIGNLITDALRAETGAQIALMNGGGIRADIDEGPVTIGEVLTVLPFGNTVSTLKLTGAGVLAVLENSASRIGTGSGTGRFAQVSGLRYRVDASQESGHRIVSADVQQADGSYAGLESAAHYSLVTNNFMRTGGDGYTVLRDDAMDAYDFGRPLEEVLIDHMIMNNPVKVEREGRVIR